jgi:molybdenum cofactor synthesis domain-containing protein
MTLRFAILTASDRSASGERPDLSGPALTDFVQANAGIVVHSGIVPDNLAVISKTLATWADNGDMDIILVTGGTGFSPRDVTPEATKAILEREAPGLAEAMRSASMQVTQHAMLSRGVAGIRGKVIIVDLPGSPKAAVENLKVILPVLPHAVELLRESPIAESHHQTVK